MQTANDYRHLLLGIRANEKAPDHYRVLGLERLELNLQAIDNAAQRQIQHLRRHLAGVHESESANLISSVESARDCLLDKRTHAVYAGRLQGFDPHSDELDVLKAWRDFQLQFDKAWEQSQQLDFDAQHFWLGVPRHQRPASNHQLLGLVDDEFDPTVVRLAAERQISFVRKFAAGQHREEANQLLAQLARARSFLLRSKTANEQEKFRRIDPTSSHGFAPGSPHSAQVVTSDVRSAKATPSERAISPASYSSQADTVTSGRETPEPEVDARPVVKVRSASPGRKRRRKRSNFFSLFVVPPLVISLMVCTSYVVITRVQSFLEEKRQPTVDVAAFIADMDRLLDNRRTDEAEALWSKLQRDYPDVVRSPALEPTRARLDELLAMERRRVNQFMAHVEQIKELGPQEASEAIERLEQQAQTPAEISIAENLQERHETREIDAPEEPTQPVDSELQIIERQLATLESRVRQTTPVTTSDRRLVEAVQKRLDDFKRRFSPLTAEKQSAFDVLVSRASQLRRSTSSDVAPSSEKAQEIAVKEAFEPDFGKPRSFEMNSGLKFEARVVDLDREKVTFQRLKDQRRAVVSLSELIPEDRQHLLRTCFDNQDAWQFQKALPYLKQIRDGNRVADNLVDLHDQFPESPYGGLWGAVGLSEGRNDVDKATKLLLQVIGRLERQRAVSSKRHRMTLASAYNNLAICELKDQEVRAAARYFIDAVEALPAASEPILHNARSLRRLASNASPVWDIGKSMERRLGDVLKSHAQHPTQLPDRWFYCLDAQVYDPALQDQDKPQELLSQSRVLGMAGVPQIKNTWCLFCKGAGAFPCQYGNCVKGNISVSRRVRVGVNGVTGEPIMGTKMFPQVCPNCRGTGTVQCTRCKQGRSY